MLGRPRALAAALASVLAATPAMAQPKSSNKSPQEVASDLVKQAITKSQQGDHLAAIDLYLNAYSLLPQHTLLSNVGNEYQQAGKPIEALKYFCMYLEKDPTGTNATYATAKARALQIELGNKDVDDKTVCKPPRQDPPTPKDPPTGPVTGTQGPDEPPAVKRSGGDGGGGSLKIAGIAVGAVGLIGVSLGTYYGLKAQDRSDFISNHDPTMEWPANIRDIEAEGKSFEKRQIILTIAGGAATAIGVALYIVGATRTSSPEKLTVQPTATGDSVGLTIGRGF